MLKIVLICVVLYVLAQVASDWFVRSQAVKHADKNMAKIVEEMNRNLPQTNEFMQIEKVEYADRIMRYSGTVLGRQTLTEAFKTSTQQQLKKFYCDRAEFRRAKVSVSFSFRDTVSRGSGSPWSSMVGPEDCK
jgi:hypothetical protein